jgi:hypothetical protein
MMDIQWAYLTTMFFIVYLMTLFQQLRRIWMRFITKLGEYILAVFQKFQFKTVHISYNFQTDDIANKFARM